MGVRMRQSDPVLAALLCAPDDDEPETDDERQAVAEAMAELQAGQFVSADEMLDDIS